MILIELIEKYVITHPSIKRYDKTDSTLIITTEHELGFALPQTLKDFYLNIGNGYYGSWVEFLGLPGGHRSDIGNVVEGYEMLKEGEAREGKLWQKGLLPFCGWGCAIFSCVDCVDANSTIYTFEEGKVWKNAYNIEQFFQWWIEEENILKKTQGRMRVVKKRNPFTGGEMNVKLDE